MNKTTCGKVDKDCTYQGKPMICGKTVVKETLQQCSKCYEKDLNVLEDEA